MKLLFKIAAVVALSLSAVSAQAAVLVHFSFSNGAPGNVAGTVTGTITGLSDNATGAATGVFLDSYPAGLNNVGYSSDVFAWPSVFFSENSFTLSNGVVTASEFIAQANGSGAQLWLNGFQSTNFLNVDGTDSHYVWNQDGAAGITYTVTGVGGAPEPASWAMLILGFGMAGSALRRRRSAGAGRMVLA